MMDVEFPAGSLNSMVKSLSYLSTGLVQPLALQRKMNTYYMQNLELSRHKGVHNVHHGAVCDLNVDNTENRYLLSGASDGTMAIHDLEDLREEPPDALTANSYRLVCRVSPGGRNAHKQSVKTVQWYPLDTGIFTSSGSDKVLKIWDANLLQTAEEYEFNGAVHCHHMSTVASKHSMIAVGTDSSVVKLVDPRAGSATHSLRGHKEAAVITVQWSNRDEFILATGGTDGFAILWDVRTAKGCLMKFKETKDIKKSRPLSETTHCGPVAGARFAPDGLHLITVGTDKKLHMWNIWTGAKIRIRYPVLSSVKKHVRFYLTSSGSENFAFIPTGNSITATSISLPGHTSELCGHFHGVNCCVYHEFRHQLISGGSDQRVLIWTHKGDRHFNDCLSEKKKTDGTGTQASLSATELLRLDTWSDEENT